ncbi:MAG: TetR/AcrR family transcriptional regulator [Actinobacteria bacterium]|nr:TetR/AcrR family transcriptional regulator [Actinomycetota bacterium]
METHRRQVHDAILDATAELIAEQGPLSVAMSAIAERAGVGRATLYKYFPDIESILVAWHARAFADHLDHLKALSEAPAVTLDDLTHFVHARRRHHPHHKGGDGLRTLAHALADTPGAPGAAIEREILAALTRLLRRLVQLKQVRADHDPELLARWLLHAVHAPAELDDVAVVQLLVDSLAAKPAARRR